MVLPYNNIVFCILKGQRFWFSVLEYLYAKDSISFFILFYLYMLCSCVQQVADSNGEFFLKSSELFESPVYLEEVADVLCILQAGELWSIFVSSFCYLLAA